MLTSPIGVRCAIDALTVKNAGDASSKSSEALITSDITNASEWIYGEKPVRLQEQWKFRSVVRILQTCVLKFDHV